MRISTNMIFDKGVARMNDQQSTLLKTQQQIAANRRVLTPSDDPIAAARSLDLSQGQSVNAQYGVNRQSATDSLQFEESALGNITGLIQDVQAQVIAAGNASYDDTQRGYIATELRGRFEELMGLANTRDGEGNYVFSGYNSSAQSFTATSSGAQYLGDQGKKLMQVGPARQMQVSDSGDAVFESIKSFGKSVVTGDAGNTGNATASAVTFSNSQALNVDLANFKFKVEFAVDSVSGTATYTVDTVPATSGVTPVAVPCDTSQPIQIQYQGMGFTITPGTVAIADGDAFTVEPSQEKQSLFTTLNDLIKLLETPAAGNVAAVNNLNRGLAIANGSLSNALDNVLTVRAGVGARLKELESLDSAGTDRDLQYSEAISNLVDLDYNKALSDLAKQKITLEAAQKSFVQTTGLSLFDLL